VEKLSTESVAPSTPAVAQQGPSAPAASPAAPPPEEEKLASEMPRTHHGVAPSIRQRLKTLEEHLQDENPVLVGAVQSFRVLDRIAYRMGLLPRDRSFASQIPWWPLVSILGTFSAGKSSFVNHYLGYDLQRTGNQAVDDKFTVVCYSRDNHVRVLPGLALNTDVRFPFFGMSDEIEKVAPGEGKRIDTYLQLKTCPSERLKGKILIDSPGFDADAQRTSTLRICNHMIRLSDLVIVFFDARHPEPGAMRDTLEHLVARTRGLPDSTKILYVLNQIDTTLHEDNAEEVVAAWQRAMAEKGLTAGRFYCISNPDIPVRIENPELKRRFEAKRDADLDEIKQRIEQVEVGRSYRVVGVLDHNARHIAETVVPQLNEALDHWRRLVIWSSSSVFGVASLIALVSTIRAGWWKGIKFSPPWWEAFMGSSFLFWFVTLVIVGLGSFVHWKIRRLCANHVRDGLNRDLGPDPYHCAVALAFEHSTAWWRSIFAKHPAGWSTAAAAKVEGVTGSAEEYVQTLNNHFASPSG